MILNHEQQPPVQQATAARQNGNMPAEGHGMTGSALVITTQRVTINRETCG
jgi:hypothetical protein